MRVPPVSSALLDRIRRELGQVIHGKADVIDLLLVGVLGGGHVLVEDVPGVGKTTLAKALARTFRITFTRVQFTPDLLPADILGSQVLNPKEGTFSFHRGPVFTNVATSQKGTKMETKGNWRPAIAESVTWSRPLTAASVTIGVPMAPHATGAVLARRLSTADWKGLKPRPTMTAPAMATGVPKPEVPSIIAPNENAISTHWSRRSKEM